MESGGKLKTEYNLHNEACDDNNFDVQLKRQVRGLNLFSFSNDQSSTSSKKVFGLRTKGEGWSTAN